MDLKNQENTIEEGSSFVESLRHNLHVRDILKCAMTITRLGVWEWHITDNRVSVSDEVLEIFGLNRTDFDGTLEYIQNHIIHPDSRVSFSDTIRQAIESGVVIQQEYKILRTDGGEGWVRVNGQVFSERSSRLKVVLGTIQDVTYDMETRHSIMENLGFYESLLEVILNPVFFKDVNGVYRFCNDAFLQYTGLSKDQVIGHSSFEISPPELATAYWNADQELIQTKGIQVYESKVRYADGTYRDVIFNKAAWRSSTDEVLGIVGVIQDISEKKAIERNIKMLQRVKDALIRVNHAIIEYESLKQFFDALLSELVPVFDSSEQASILSVDESGFLCVLSNIGYEYIEAEEFKINIKESFIWRETEGDLNQVCIIPDVQKYIELGSPNIPTAESKQIIRSNMTVPILHNNRVQWLICFDSHVMDRFNEVDRKVAEYLRGEIPILIRVFDLYNETLRLSRFDSLTGLMNRSYFDAILSDRLIIASRSGIPMQIVVFDLDGLKAVNDCYGHYAGDRYICEFSNKIQEAFRKSDALARIGGDEFAGIFTDSEHPVFEEKLATLRQRFGTAIIKVDTGEFAGSFSYGIATFGKDAVSKDELIRIADYRMYLDKNRRRKAGQGFE